MNRLGRICGVVLLSLGVAPFTFGKTQRDPVQRAAFMHQHACPSTGKTKGRCPGYVVDHIKPLCAGGPDTPSNMQWQTVRQARQKDQVEREQYKRR
jgi:hypothetical protein